MPPSELERQAYIAGDTKTAARLAELVDQAARIELLEEEKDDR